MRTWGGWTTTQRFAVRMGLFTALSGLVGLVSNPDFAVGDDATAESLIVSWNGWRAVIALTVGIPGLAIAWLPQWAAPYLIYRAVTDAGAALWAALDDRPLGVLFLPASSDAILHLVLAIVAALGVVLARGEPVITPGPA